MAYMERTHRMKKWVLLSGCCELLLAEDNSLLCLWDAEQQDMRKLVVLSVFYYPSPKSQCFFCEKYKWSNSGGIPGCKATMSISSANNWIMLELILFSPVKTDHVLCSEYTVCSTRQQCKLCCQVVCFILNFGRILNKVSMCKWHAGAKFSFSITINNKCTLKVWNYFTWQLHS